MTARQSKRGRPENGENCKCLLMFAQTQVGKKTQKKIQNNPNNKNPDVVIPVIAVTNISPQVGSVADAAQLLFCNFVLIWTCSSLMGQNDA